MAKSMRLSKAWALRAAAEAKDGPLIFDDVRPDLCPALSELILSISRSPSTLSLNKGGWKSSVQFLRSMHPSVVGFRTTLAELLGSASVGWAIVNRNGSLHQRHQHRIAVLSWVYFVTTGDPITPTIFETRSGELGVDPKVGRLVVFSDEMWHRVPPYPGEEPRVTIAGDIR